MAEFGANFKTLLRTVGEASGLSRRKAFAAIRQGLVQIDGRQVFDPSSPYEGGKIRLAGQELSMAPVSLVYLMLNKPSGVISTSSDEQGRRTVMDFVPPALRASGLHSVGRLDRDTTGLLLLTNDGALTYKLTHPSQEIEKEYWLAIGTPVYDYFLSALEQGVELDGKLRRPLHLWRLNNQAPFQFAMIITEGRKRQVRRMVMALGARVTRLKRVREGPLELGSLREGEVRKLSDAEVEMLQGEA